MSLRTKIRQWLIAQSVRHFGYITWHRRPVRSADFKRTSFSTSTLPSYAIVLQGPVLHTDNFTVETLKIYTQTFPGAPLIVSTRADTSPEALQELSKLPNVHVVTTQDPSFRGYGNSNLQIDSTVAGLKKAKELGVEYAFKTRTDQRMYATDVFAFLYGLIESFPLTTPGKQRKRIVALGYSTIKYRPYSLNDMFFFGTLHDLLLYWDIPHDTRRIKEVDTIGQWQAAKVCEGYFLTTFLQNIGHDIKDTLEDFWDALGTYFILIDPTDIDWYWNKYAQRFEEYHYRTYDKVIVGEEVCFKEWLIFARGWSSLEPKPYHLADLPNDTHTTRVPFQ